MKPLHRIEGVVVRVKFTGGYAFVRALDSGADYFMHARDISPRTAFNTLFEGERVTFCPTETPDGKLRAKEVHRCR